MKIQSQGRQTGKTEDMLRWLSRGRLRRPRVWSRLLIVADERRVLAARERLHEMIVGEAGTLPPELAQVIEHHAARLQDQIMTVETYRLGHIAHPDVEVGIDELDDVLSVIFHASVALATLTESEVQ